MFLHVTEAKYIGKYRVEVRFNDGRQGVADLSQALTGPVFEPLKDESLFAQLQLNEELDTICWPNGADLAPEFLYFLAFKSVPELQNKFKAWGYIA